MHTVILVFVYAQALHTPSLAKAACEHLSLERISEPLRKHSTWQTKTPSHACMHVDWQWHILICRRHLAINVSSPILGSHSNATCLSLFQTALSSDGPQRVAHAAHCSMPTSDLQHLRLCRFILLSKDLGQVQSAFVTSGNQALHLPRPCSFVQHGLVEVIS